MVIEPASGDYGGTIKVSNARLCEQSREDVSDNTTYGMGCEDLTVKQSVSMFLYYEQETSYIESIVVTSEEFQLSGKIANCPSNEAKCNGSS